ncbi:LOC102547344 [Phodopus roborovskii]|uniref:LOC102547344 protein n=1 Tax=Phodopus roborovskii TaxID=109678 RepID=A0AAV0A8I6_PHORO|nr:LOC102547344 [Phodopus roborovskii]
MTVCRRLQIDPHLLPCTKLKSKWIKDFNINLATLNLLEEKVGRTLEQIGTGDCFLNITPVAQTLRLTINKWDLLKLRSFCRLQKPTETADLNKEELMGPQTDRTLTEQGITNYNKTRHKPSRLDKAIQEEEKVRKSRQKNQRQPHSHY